MAVLYTAEHPAAHPGWALEGSGVARRYGDAWAAEGRTPALAVPTVPGQPAGWNVVLNLSHPESRRVRPLDPFDVTWDGRLFGPPPDAARVDGP